MRIPTSKQDKGFTLIELLVVVVIIGILAAIAIPVFLNQREKAAEAGVKSDLKNAATVMESYYVDNNNTYPADTATLTDLPDFQKTGTNSITLALQAGGEAYCLTGTTDADDATPFYYDSDDGGLVAACEDD